MNSQIYKINMKQLSVSYYYQMTLIIHLIGNNLKISILKLRQSLMSSYILSLNPHVLDTALQEAVCQETVTTLEDHM